MDKRTPRVLVFDIETAPILAYVWSIWEQNVGLNQIASDWHLMSWAAKWLGEKTIMYMDQRNVKDLQNDKAILVGLWKLLDEADAVITQNGKSFDSKKVNARFVMSDMGPPSPYQHIDTKRLATKHFAFTSNKLEYMSDKINKKYKKLSHRKFNGFELWKECIKGNAEAWNEMEKYNKLDVLATEELYYKLSPWGGTGVDLNIFRGPPQFLCQCGSSSFQRKGYAVTRSGKFSRLSCKECGAWSTDKSVNYMSKEKKLSLKGRGG